ncbi:MAG TPA: carbohydrate-binding protein [Thermoanaerobaculia bacterium]|nr:carbohydrate-binding protein [Thermoanaerobaculia bacterium]
MDAGNNGGEYRATDADVRSKSTASNGYVVFNAVAGEWLEYTIDVAAAGTYQVGATSASRLAGGTYHIEIDGVNVTGTLTAPTTGSWWTFQYAGQGGVQLTAGRHVLRLVLDTNGVEGIVADFDTILISR